MKLTTLTHAIAVAVLVLAPLATPVVAQEQMSPEEAERLMNAINGKMRELEQMLAKASLEPEDLEAIIQQLRHAVENNEVERLPRSLREFLLNNPDLLAKLKDPSAQGDDLTRVEDEIRRLLATEEDGLEQLLRDNPEMLQRLLQQQDQIEDALRNHAELENNLERLFDQAKGQMESTETDIEKLIELAQQMQQQMNQQGQPGNQQQQLQQEQQQQQQGQERQTENNQQEDPQGAERNYSNDQSRDGNGGSGGNLDPEAWDTILPRTDRERGHDPRAQARPRDWDAEAARYFRLLAQQARRERLRQQQGEQPGNGTGGADNGNGNGSSEGGSGGN